LSRPGILFIKHYSTNAKFILNDRDILEKEYDVEVYTAYTKKNFLIVFSLLKQFFHLLFRAGRYKLYFVWFADYHSFIPVLFAKLFGKKSVIAVGGYDATDIPEIDCGAFNESTFKKRMRSFAVRFSLKNADKILVVDDSLIENTNTYVYSDIPGKKDLKDGILNFVPEVKNKIEIVYTGFDEGFFKLNKDIPKENFVLSVGYSPNDNEFRRKGFDMLIKAAEILKEVSFVIIGVNEEQLKNLLVMNLKNVKFFTSVSMEELIGYYNRAKVFAQLSLFEGQPNSLCEAMMMECIPVGSDVNGIPRVIGDTGFIVHKKNAKEISEKILLALDSPLEKGALARQRIIDNFSLVKRESKILETVRSLLN